MLRDPVSLLPALARSPCHITPYASLPRTRAFASYAALRRASNSVPQLAKSRVNHGQLEKLANPLRLLREVANLYLREIVLRFQTENREDFGLGKIAKPFQD